MEPVIVSCEESATKFLGQCRVGIYAGGCTASALTGEEAFGESPDVQLRIIVGSPVAHRGARIPRRFRRLLRREKRAAWGRPHVLLRMKYEAFGKIRRLEQLRKIREVRPDSSIPAFLFSGRKYFLLSRFPNWPLQPAIRRVRSQIEIDRTFTQHFVATTNRNRTPNRNRRYFATTTLIPKGSPAAWAATWGILGIGSCQLGPRCFAVQGGPP